MNSKLLLLAGIALAGGVALYSAPQVWVSLSLAEGAAAFSQLEVTGQQVNQSLSPVAIAALASALALTIAGKAFRRVLGVLVLLLGGRWKAAGRKYEADSGSARPATDEPDRISDWEALNAGDDPTQSP